MRGVFSLCDSDLQINKSQKKWKGKVFGALTLITLFKSPISIKSMEQLKVNFSSCILYMGVW